MTRICIAKSAHIWYNSFIFLSFGIAIYSVFMFAIFGADGDAALFIVKNSILIIFYCCLFYCTLYVTQNMTLSAVVDFVVYTVVLREEISFLRTYTFSGEAYHDFISLIGFMKWYIVISACLLAVGIFRNARYCTYH